ncbi:hypothetical protein F8O01_17690 [Pseudoclavibacter chungangensis]|uniref:Very short patch repair endonuclease n=1 Tax=Pseudoclavibacter chungangensis TaxID=587635 RepID=A0A7J5BNR7_9MICO|nr:hypothetical protein [Pseudoclavibacter chungangensis]KAB1651693.1 hypothetical protein F8O01_17690 [Pseudoclavibacter chungangensis]
MVGGEKDERRHVPAASSEGRRRNMQANRRRDTKPELALRSALHRAGFRYRCDFRIDLPEGRVRPDIVFTRKRALRTFGGGEARRVMVGG